MAVNDPRKSKEGLVLIKSSAESPTPYHDQYGLLFDSEYVVTVGGIVVLRRRREEC